MEENYGAGLLDKRPLELYLPIFNQFSLADKACLTLCNRHLLSTIGETTIPQLSRKRGIKHYDTWMELLHRLARDLPQYYPCFSCRQLHLWQSVSLPDGRSALPACPRCLWQETRLIGEIGRRQFDLLKFEQFPHHSNYKLDFAHIQLVMRRFYYGPEYGIPVESLRFTEVSTTRIHPVKRRSSKRPKTSLFTETKEPFKRSLVLLSEKEKISHRMTTLISIEGRICSTPPSLGLRLQQLAVVARQNESELNPLDSKYGSRHFCGHWMGRNLFSDLQRMTDNIFKQPKKYRSKSRSIREAGYGQCNRCSTVWKLELRDLGPKEVCLVMTWWVDLGPGSSRDDFQWRQLLSSGTDENAPPGLHADARLQFERDSIQAASPGALSEQALSDRNIKILQERRPKVIGASVVVET